MPKDHLFNVINPEGTSAGNGYGDRAAAEHAAMSQSRRKPGIWKVKPFGSGQIVAKFEHGKRVR